ncbi:hypothetical protein DRO91_02775 [Candidatus Heimdallarchaeota archaeon]|nr:MAG: hypothetical protein DRO91_02775 [Candidatus Heimdallarchaeota archaeon]
MSVFNRSYREYKGEIKGRFFKIWSIATQTLRVQFSGKKIIFLLILCNLPVISFTLMLIFSAIFFPAFVREFFLGGLGGVDATMYTIINFSFNPGLIFLPIVFICALNSGTIANDKKNNSLALYFSRPITRIDYAIGKALSVYMVSSFVTFVPWFVFLVTFNLLEGVSGLAIKTVIMTYLSTFASGFLIVFFMGSIVLYFSSISKQSVLGGILSILVLFLPSLVASLIAEFIEADWIQYFSIALIIVAAVFLIFGSPSTSMFGMNFFESTLSGGVAITLMITIGIIFLLMTINRLYREEVS